MADEYGRDQLEKNHEEDEARPRFEIELAVIHGSRVAWVTRLYTRRHGRWLERCHDTGVKTGAGLQSGGLEVARVDDEKQGKTAQSGVATLLRVITWLFL